MDTTTYLEAGCALTDISSIELVTTVAPNPLVSSTFLTVGDLSTSFSIS